MTDPYSLGVDLGTTYTSAAAFQDGRAVVLPLDGDQLAVPSVVYVTPEGQVAIGAEALRYAVDDPAGLVRHVKRRLGSTQRFLVRGTQYSAEQLTAVALRSVIDRAQELLGSEPTHVTLTHPANWHEHRQARLQEAAAMIGLESVGLKAEPDAAAVYHAGRTSVPTGAVLAVYDLGGGTFDASIIRKTDQGLQLAGEPTGVDNLGGVDFDRLLSAHVKGHLGTLLDTVEEDGSMTDALYELERRVVEAKVALSNEISTSVLVDLPTGTTEVLVTRSEFEALIEPLLEQTVDELERALEIAGVEPADVHAVLLVGGSSRIPMVSRLISTRLSCHVESTDEPKVSVCLGAAITAEAVARGAAKEEAVEQVQRKPAPTVGEHRLERTSSQSRSHGTLFESGAEPSTKPKPALEHLGPDRSIAMSVDLTDRGLTGANDRTIDVATVSDHSISIPREVIRPQPAHRPEPAPIPPPTPSQNPLIVILAIAAIVLAVVVAAVVLT